MQSAEYWQSLFEGWPAGFPTQGILITSFQEAIPFTGFMISEGMIVLDRDKPDSSGARKVILAYDVIAALKITSTFELDRFQELGFRTTQQF
ncbi:MAG: hypothetical protein KF861_10160 [Planctomycetaceae bacterium]|nr:hypothetical protein [Planctomycetaceae bacterium]